MIEVFTNDMETHDLNLATVDLYSDLTFLVSGLRGEKGERGEPGLTGRNGLNGRNGISIESVEQIESSSESLGDNVIQVTLENGMKFDFTIKNGAQGTKGDKGDAGTTDYNGLTNKPTPTNFIIKEEDLTVTYDDTKGVAPYNVSYGYTNIVISKDAGVKWVEGAMYMFVLNNTIGSSNYRNGRIKIEGEDTWLPMMDAQGAIITIHGSLTKVYCSYKWTYKTTYQENGALHRDYDANTTYAYLVNTIPTGNVTIDSKGFGARYSLIFPTTPMEDPNERWSSLVSSYTANATKNINTGITKFYIDRKPLYIYSAGIDKGKTNANPLYYDYATYDLRYTYNINATYISTNKRVFMWLKNYNEDEDTFEADATIGNIFTLDKLSTRFPNLQEDIYLYLIGCNSTSYYTISPTFGYERYTIYKYDHITGKLKGVK